MSCHCTWSQQYSISRYRRQTKVAKNVVPIPLVLYLFAALRLLNVDNARLEGAFNHREERIRERPKAGYCTVYILACTSGTRIKRGTPRFLAALLYAPPREDWILLFWLPQNLSNHMDRQARTSDTVLVKSREMTGTVRPNYCRGGRGQKG